MLGINKFTWQMIYFFPPLQSYFSAKLSASICQMCVKENRKSLVLGSSTEDQTAPVSPAAKRFRVDRAMPENPELTPEECAAKLEEVQQEWNENHRGPVLKLLMASIRCSIRTWIQTSAWTHHARCARQSALLPRRRLCELTCNLAWVEIEITFCLTHYSEYMAFYNNLFPQRQYML